MSSSGGHRTTSRSRTARGRRIGATPSQPDAGSWWLTPGGGVTGSEAIEEAAVREVFEETGLELDQGGLGRVVAERVAGFDFEGRQFRQTEYFFAAEVTPFTPRSHGWNAMERRSLLDQRWWRVDELRSTGETIYPSELADLVQVVLDGGVRELLRLSGS